MGDENRSLEPEMDVERVSHLDSFSQDVRTRAFQRKRGDKEGRFAHVWVSEPEAPDKDKASRGLYGVGDPDVLSEIGGVLNKEQGDYSWYGYDPQVKDPEREAEMLGNAEVELVRETREKKPQVLPILSEGIKKIENTFGAPHLGSQVADGLEKGASNLVGGSGEGSEPIKGDTGESGKDTSEG